jgi:hypothetical protein
VLGFAGLRLRLARFVSHTSDCDAKFSAAGLGKLEEVEGRPDPRYTGLIIHDLRRSAIKNLMKVE